MINVILIIAIIAISSYIISLVVSLFFCDFDFKCHYWIDTLWSPVYILIGSTIDILARIGLCLFGFTAGGVIAGSTAALI